MRRRTLLAATSLSFAAGLATSGVSMALAQTAGPVPVTFGTDPTGAHPRYAQEATYVDRNAASSAPEALSFESEDVAAAVEPEPLTITVEAGDTVYGLARKHDLSPAEIIAANGLKAPFSLALGQTLTLPGGEMPAPIVAAAAEATIAPTPSAPSANPSLLREIERVEDAKESAGAAPDVPRRADAIYAVRQGDTLYSLARRFEVPLNDLAAANGLDAPFTLSLGQSIVVPSVVPITEERPVETLAAAATLPAPEEPRPEGQFAWPIRGAIVSGYGALLDGVRNDGINIAAPAGAPVRAAGDGEVVYKGDELAGYGNLLLVKHEDGWVSAYAHTGAILVSKGDRVSKGQVIAKVGKTGSVDAPQLHFELRHDLKPQDPIAALNGTLTNAGFYR